MSRSYSKKTVTLFHFYAHEQNKLIIIYAVHYLIQLSSEGHINILINKHTN